ncbi:hypothetical protein M413DRAFT_23141 [Hebeloma cylindrosporum]|uniref:Uncharacterized protein n=1 Tax=Hebeloma cylindrosporum TaxID=76867 RepID=A0A0C3CDC9_HEBCY|nr:hypothetical protein M413DRAFT_23141 [Hebeloma cylindrosporum h7]
MVKTYIWGGQSQSEKMELPPEVVCQILQHIPIHIRPRRDVFTRAVLSSGSFFHSFDIAAISAPLVCSSWKGPGTAALYELITTYSEAQCILLLRTLRENPSLRRLIRLLHLPHAREPPIATPYGALQVSAGIVAACTHVYELDVQAR